MMEMHDQTSRRREKALAALKALIADCGDTISITTSNRQDAKRFLNGIGWPSNLYESAAIDDLTDWVRNPHVHQTFLQEQGFSNSCMRKSLFRASNAYRVCGNVQSKEGFLLVANALLGGEEDMPPQDETGEEDTRTPDWLRTGQAEKKPMPTQAMRPEAEQAAEHLAAALSFLAHADEKPTLDEEQINKLIDKRIKELPAYRIELKRGDEKRELPEGLRHEMFETLLKAVDVGVNVLLVGPAGSGKTTLAEQIADALGIPFYFNGAIASEYKLNGFIDANGKYIDTAFRKAFEKGGLYLFDELDGSLPQAVLAFNAALANGQADFPDGNIKMHEDFRCMAAANTYGRGADRQYVGRNQLDAASIDRFVSFDLNYDEKLEAALCGDDDWCGNVQKIRRGVEKAKVRHVVSPRASIHGAKLLGAGIPWPLVEDAVIWKGLDQETRTRIMKAA